MQDHLKFLATVEEEELIVNSFRAYNFRLDFSKRNPDYLKLIPQVGGVYFIAGRNSKLLKAYVGKTNCLQRRITDYHRSFQVHCPND